MIGQLYRKDEEPHAGGVVAIMEGVDNPFMLRPNSTHAQGKHEFVGACDMLYGAAKIKEMDRDMQSFRLV